MLYLDRICMSQAVVPIQKELGLSNTGVSYVLMAFTLAYGLFAVPAGRLATGTGPRSVLASIVIAWSAFTALTGAATGLVTLVLVRFLFGAAEAGAFPNAAKVMSRWFPVGERGRVQGVMLAFAQIGAVVAPAGRGVPIDARRLALDVLRLRRWSASRGRSGSGGGSATTRPTHRGVNAAELAEIRADESPPAADPGPIPWGAVFTNRGDHRPEPHHGARRVLHVLLLLVVPEVPARRPRGGEPRPPGGSPSLVMAGSAVGMLIGGWLADRISRSQRSGPRPRYLGVACYFIAAACLFLGVRCDDPLVTRGAVGRVDVRDARHAAELVVGDHPAGRAAHRTVFGLMNGLGVLGAMASQGFVGVFADWQAERGLTGREQWDPIFDVYVCVLRCECGCVVVLSLHAARRTHREEEEENW